MDEVFLSDKKNDLSFLWKDQAVVLVEHQSSINPNMPVRLLLYSAFQLLANLIDPKTIYGTKLVKILAPHFYVFYIGDDMDVDEDTLKLSASFRETKADLELVCHVFNITYKEHREILERCQPLREYSFLVHQVEQNKKSGMPLGTAIREAVMYCIAHGIMGNFLEEHREEVIEMIALQWDSDVEKKVLREEGVEEGLERGRAEGRAEGKTEGKTEGKAEAARSLMETLHCTKEKAMELLKIPAELRPKVLALL